MVNNNQMKISACCRFKMMCGVKRQRCTDCEMSTIIHLCYQQLVDRRPTGEGSDPTWINTDFNLDFNLLCGVVVK